MKIPYTMKLAGVEIDGELEFTIDPGEGRDFRGAGSPASPPSIDVLIFRCAGVEISLTPDAEREAEEAAWKAAADTDEAARNE